MKVLYTGGTFDLFHAGHANFLRQCSLISDKVVVSLNSDDFIFKYKGFYPILPYNERKKVLESCKYVNEVIENIGGNDSKITIELVRPNIIAIGTDWAAKNYYEQMSFSQEWLDEKNIVLVYLPYCKYKNTTAIKKEIKEK